MNNPAKQRHVYELNTEFRRMSEISEYFFAQKTKNAQTPFMNQYKLCLVNHLSFASHPPSGLRIYLCPCRICIRSNCISSEVRG